MEGTRDNFRNLATEAKKRMKYGYWTSILTSRKVEIDDAKKSGKGTDNIYSYYRNKVMSDFYRDCLPVSDEEVMYCKVCQILDSEDNVTNILGLLMDKDYYNKSNTEERARYVLNLSKLFIKMKQRYLVEKRN